jgi:hypothetical protein
MTADTEKPRVVFGEPLLAGIRPDNVMGYCSWDGTPIGYGQTRCGECGRVVMNPVELEEAQENHL